MHETWRTKREPNQHSRRQLASLYPATLRPAGIESLAVRATARSVAALRGQRPRLQLRLSRRLLLFVDALIPSFVHFESRLLGIRNRKRFGDGRRIYSRNQFPDCFPAKRTMGQSRTTKGTTQFEPPSTGGAISINQFIFVNRHRRTFVASTSRSKCAVSARRVGKDR